MFVLACPISGGGFVSQLAIMQHLCAIKFTPTLTLASSGGNLAAYIAAAANWKWAAIERIARDLTQDLFARPWSSMASMSMVVGYFKGNVYDRGSGVKEFIKKFFTESSITKYEIWTGTYNKNLQKARLFCNRCKDTTRMDVTCIDHELTQTMESVFCGGDLEMISMSGLASASIPGIVPPQRILDDDYIDGGVAGASPLTIMQEPIMKYVKDHNEPLHIIYINSVDLSAADVKPAHNVLDTWKQATDDIVRSQTVIDRFSGYELIRHYPGTMNKQEFACNYENLKCVKLIQSKVSYSMLEIYPTQNFDINIASFNGDDVINAIHKAYPSCRCRMWWISDDTVCNTEICSLFDACRIRDETTTREQSGTHESKGELSGTASL